MKKIQWLKFALCVCALGVLNMCSPSTQPKKVASDKPIIVATTGMVADVLRQILHEDAEVTCLLAATVDPHSYSPSLTDVKLLQKADVVVANGLRLEGKMEEIFSTMSKQGRSVFFLGNALNADTVLSEIHGSNRVADPHIWGDLAIWGMTVDYISSELGRLYPNQASVWKSRGANYRTQLLKAHAGIKELVKRIPEPKRILVTSHDAFRYFGRAYGFQVRGAQGLSTVTEAGLRDMVELTAFIKTNAVPAIFVETSVGATLIERLSKDTGAKIGGKLYSDSLGQPGEKVTLSDGSTVPADTVIGMQWSNMQTVVAALQPAS